MAECPCCGSYLWTEGSADQGEWGVVPGPGLVPVDEGEVVKLEDRTAEGLLQPGEGTCIPIASGVGTAGCDGCVAHTAIEVGMTRLRSIPMRRPIRPAPTALQTASW